MCKEISVHIILYCLFHYVTCIIKARSCISFTKFLQILRDNKQGGGITARSNLRSIGLKRTTDETLEGQARRSRQVEL